MSIPIETSFLSAAPARMGESELKREFSRLLESGRLICAGDAKRDPLRLLRQGQFPKSKIVLFGTTIYLTRPRQNPDLRFFVAYVVPPIKKARPQIFARIFYKDVSLVWRAATHLFLDGEEMWIGKGDTKIVRSGRWEQEESNEATTDLPFELQNALESLNRSKKIQQATAVLPLVLKRAPRDRIRAYEDFVGPRRRVQANAGNRIHSGRSVVRFQVAGDPASLRVAAGFEPDFEEGLVDVATYRSRLYGGAVSRFRIVSTNRKIQHLFFRGPKHVWMIPPQALTTELSSYGVRLVDVEVDEDAYVPGYEYHFYEDDADGRPQLHSQIPAGFAGPASPLDDTRADASKWLDKLPLIKQFRQFAKRR